MTKVIATHIRNINDIFIGIVEGILLEYFAYYHPNIANTWWKMNKICHDN